MNAMIRQAQKMQDEISELQEDIESRDFTATAGGGAVSVTVTGKKTVKALEIKPEVVDPEDIEMLQDLIISAVNEAVNQVEATTECSKGTEWLVITHSRWNFWRRSLQNCRASG